jgi:hypothetical protein
MKLCQMCVENSTSKERWKPTDEVGTCDNCTEINQQLYVPATIQCDFTHCAHGYSPASSNGEGCYAGNPKDPECKGFVTDEK